MYNKRSGKRMVWVLAGLGLAASAPILGAQEWKEWVGSIRWREPVVVTPGESHSPPSDAIVLFDGSDLSAWNDAESWIIEDGAATVASSASTKQSFSDCQLHLEFATPAKVTGKGQGRGNSGVYFMGRYELQILDSYENTTYFDGQCGAIYKQQPPLVNACRPPGEWQTYDVIFRAPQFHPDGSLKSRARITAFQNGVLIQDNFELLGGTFWHQPPIYLAHPDREPLSLQFHGNPVRFRNIWIRDLAAPAAATEEESAAESL